VAITAGAASRLRRNHLRLFCTGSTCLLRSDTADVFRFLGSCREERVADRQSQTTSIETATTHQRCDPGTGHATTFICSTKKVNCKDFTVREPQYHKIHNASLELLWSGLGDAKRRVRLRSLTRKNSLTQCYCKLREWPGQ
jgi:hypothetical protein